MKNKKKKWVRLRHYVVRIVAWPVIALMVWLKYGTKIERFKQENGRKYLILFNHQTAYDQFLVGMAFRRPVYYLASEDLFSMGFLSRLLQWAVAPIPIKKQTNDPKAVYNCLRVAKEGGTIALSPEGNRTYGGRTGYMKPSIVKMVRALKMPLVLYRIEGGYGVHPRWSDVARKGPMRAYASKVVEPEEYKAMTDEELLQLIETELYVDEGRAEGLYPHKKAAEYLERAMYVCPWCGLSSFESHDDVVTCKTCGRQVRYLPDKSLQGINCDFPHPFVAQWYDAQCDYVNGLDVAAMTGEPIYTDTVQLSEVIVYDRKNVLQEGVTVKLYGDRLEIGADLILPYDDVQVMAVLGKNKLNIYYGEKLYQFKGSERFNALKYVNLFYRYKNIREGHPDSTFLGL
jgi:1-acyl-sn-glycerol-3-phosphate acyltransferase